MNVARGATATLTASFADSAGDPTDPTSPSVTIYSPDDTAVVTATPTRLTLGSYRYLFPVPSDAALGIWRIEWSGTIDGVLAVADDYFAVVTPGSLTTPGYVTLDDLKAFVEIEDDVDDVMLQLALDSAAAQVENFTRQMFTVGAPPATRYYSADVVTDDKMYVDLGCLPNDLPGTWFPGSLRYAKRRVDTDPIASTSGLTVSIDTNRDLTFDTDLTLDVDYILVPYTAAARGWPYTGIMATPGRTFPVADGAVRVIASFGWPAVPAPVRTAVLLQASRLFKRRLAPFGIAGSPEMGSELRLLAKLDPDVESLLQPYEVIGGFG